MRSQSELIGIIDSLQMLIGDQHIQLVELRHRRDDLLRSNNDYEQRYRDEKQLRLEAQAVLSMVVYPFPGGSPHWHLQELDEKLAKVDLVEVRNLLNAGAKAQEPSVQDATVSLSLSSYDELNSRLAVRDGLLDKVFMKITEWQNAGYKAHDGLTVLSDIQLQIYNFMNLSKAEEASFDVH